MPLNPGIEDPSTPKIKPPVSTPVKGLRSVDSNHPRTPLSRIHQLIHGGVHLLAAATSPSSVHGATPECTANTRWNKDLCTPDYGTGTRWTSKDEFTPEYGASIVRTKDRCTPEYSSCRSGSAFRTPLSVAGSGQGISRYYNPFETGLLDTLHQPIFSPNVFKTSTPGCPAPTFQWTIDEIAILKPVEIDTPQQDIWISRHSADIEERAQKAIDAYFSSNAVAPSPWSDSAKKKPFRLPQTPCQSSVSDSPMIFCNKPAEISKNAEKLAGMAETRNKSDVRIKEAGVQTVITIPCDINLEAILGSEFRYKPVDSDDIQHLSLQQMTCDDDVGGSQDILSNSSLRRKLFFHGDEGTPISPVRSVRYHNNDKIIEFEQPLSSSPPFDKHHSPEHIALPSSDLLLTDQFTSSPIKMLHTTPTVRRCSTVPQLCDSPTLSPICSFYYNATGHSNKSAEQKSSCVLNSESEQMHSHTVTPHSASAVRNDAIAVRDEIELSSANDTSGMIDESSRHHIANILTATKQGDTGYQSNIMQTTATQERLATVYQTNDNNDMSIDAECHFIDS